jgi:hypothetical protein
LICTKFACTTFTTEKETKWLRDSDASRARTFSPVSGIFIVLIVYFARRRDVTWWRQRLSARRGSTVRIDSLTKLSIPSIVAAPMAQRRNKPYMFVTWISKVLIGSRHCNWAVWFRTHFHFEKRESDSTLDQMKHTAIVRTVEAELESAGYDVYNEIWFRVEGKEMDFGGRCDIVAVKGDEGVICEVKSSANKYDSDRVQLLLYMWGLPRADNRWKGIRFNGLLAYEHERVPVSALEIDEHFMRIFKDYVADILHNEPKPRPSEFECKYCNVAECAVRQIEPDPELVGSTYTPDFF